MSAHKYVVGALVCETEDQIAQSCDEESLREIRQLYEELDPELAKKISTDPEVFYPKLSLGIQTMVLCVTQRGNEDKNLQLRRDGYVGYITLRRGQRLRGIVGIGVLTCSPTPAQLIGHIEEIVVARPHRRRGLGEQIMYELINQANEEGVDQLQLTSNERRTEANPMYQKLGFELYHTNFYRMFRKSFSSF